MGYYIHQEGVDFCIPKENFDACLQAIKGLMGQTDKMDGGSWSGGVQTDRWFAWVDTDRVLNAQTLPDALRAWRWEAGLGPNGDIIDVFFRGEKSGSDDHLLATIAPFVKDGSYIQMRGENGEMWRWTFSGGKFEEKFPQVLWK